MDEFEVNCISKPGPHSRHEHITHIGHNENGWRITKESAVIRIEGKAQRFYTVDKVSGKRAYVGVVREPGRGP